MSKKTLSSFGDTSRCVAQDFHQIFHRGKVILTLGLSIFLVKQNIETDS
jgi:hypothetical protein